MSRKPINREAWLDAAVEGLRPIFEAQGEELPEVRVSVGFPGGSGRKSNVIGQCWSTSTATDGVSQVFISPVLDDAGTVLATLTHELVHALDDCANGHKGRFIKVSKTVGLVKPWTATTASPELAADLDVIAKRLGEYPHARLTGLTPITKQGTRMLKVQCPDPECGYTVRTTRKWLEVGIPTCPCGTPMEEAD